MFIHVRGGRVPMTHQRLGKLTPMLVLELFPEETCFQWTKIGVFWTRVLYLMLTIYTWNLSDLYFGPPQHMFFSYQNRGQIGSRYIL